MHDNTITAELKILQFAEKDPDKRKSLTAFFLSGIHPRIKSHFGAGADKALLTVIEHMYATPVYSQLILDAVRQLCRDLRDEYSIAEDCTLITKINTGQYFIPQHIKDDVRAQLDIHR